jgi:hypothetical protein
LLSRVAPRPEERRIAIVMNGAGERRRCTHRRVVGTALEPFDDGGTLLPSRSISADGAVGRN